MPSNNARNADDLYFEYNITAGPWKGLDARLVSQPTQAPDYADMEIRSGKIRRGPLRLPLAHVKFVGPR